MLEIILLIAGIVKAFGRPRLRRLTPQDLPGVDSSKFEEWKSAELRATDTFLWATWGALAIKLAVSAMLSNTPLSSEQAFTWTVGIFVAWFIGLTVAAVFGSKAKKLKLEAGIAWPDSKEVKPTPATHVRCPDCREFVLKDANVCKHCGCNLIPQ